MAAEGEEGPRLGTTHPYLGPFVRYENIVLNSLCTQILTFCEKKQINKKRVLKTIFFKPRSIHTVVEGPVLWFRKNVVEAARSGEVS